MIRSFIPRLGLYLAISGTVAFTGHGSLQAHYPRCPDAARIGQGPRVRAALTALVASLQASIDGPTKAPPVAPQPSAHEGDTGIKPEQARSVAGPAVNGASQPPPASSSSKEVVAPRPAKVEPTEPRLGDVK